MSDLAGVNPQRTPGASFSRKDGSKDVPGRIYLGGAVIHFIHIPHVNFTVAYSYLSIVLRVPRRFIREVRSALEFVY